MIAFSEEKITAYRARTYRTAPGLRLASADEAVEFVNDRGFVFFWPIKGVEMPSIWAAAAGDRPVPDEHDDPGHVTWGWKDSLLGQRRWYYGRVLKHRNAMISLEMLPSFYALSPNLGDPEQDYLDQYQEGKITAEAKFLFEALLKEGPLDTISLRKTARMTSPSSDSRFNKALNDLQMEFKVLPIGVSQAGAWKYAFIYDLTHRHFPDLIPKAGLVFESDARKALTLRYIHSVGAVPKAQITRLFGWKPDLAHRAIESMLHREELVAAAVPGKSEPWIGLPQLVV